MTIITSIVTATAGAVMLSSDFQRKKMTDTYSYVYTDNTDSMLAYSDTCAIINRTSMVQRKNLEKIVSMRALKENWDNEGSHAISPSILDKVKALITYSDKYQPNIFPTPEGYVQIEFYNGDYKYFQLIITEDIVEYYLTDGKDFSNDIYKELNFDLNRLLDMINSFYNETHEYRDIIWTKNQ